MKRFRAYKIREMFAAIVFGSFVYPSAAYKPSNARIQNCILRAILYIYIYIYICVCVCNLSLSRREEQEKGRIFACN